MSALRESLASVKAELAAKPRLRAGAWAIAAILLGYCLLAQADRLTVAKQDYSRQAQGLERVAGALSREDWPDLLAAERESQRALQAALWRADTIGQAQAQMQQAVESMIEGLKLRNPRIRPGVTQPVPKLPGLARVQVELSGNFEGAAALHVLEAVATSPARLVVDRLTLRRETGYMELLLSAYFLGVALQDDAR